MIHPSPFSEEILILPSDLKLLQNGKMSDLPREETCAVSYFFILFTSTSAKHFIPSHI